MENKTKTQEQYLLDIWFGKKYWDSCCLDEAIDWSQHGYTLDSEEITEYTSWKEQYLSTIEKLSKLAPMNSTLFYACRPWVAAKENKTIVINNIKSK